jgi:DNA-directed RNA polymerase specialized sigma24 family protein
LILQRGAPALRQARRLKPVVPEVSPAELEDFYRRFFLPLVRRAVRRHGLSMEDAGDIVQDTFVLALGKLDPSGNPKAWLCQVVDHLSVNLQRKTFRRERLLARWGSKDSRLSSETNPPGCE